MSGGAAWRGALVLEGDVGWIVHVDQHDKFHSTVAGVLKASTAEAWMPRRLDRDVLAQDLERRRLREVRRVMVEQFVDVLVQASRTPDQPVLSSVQTASAESPRRIPIEAIIVPGEASDVAWEQAHEHDALVEVLMTVGFREDPLVRTSLEEFLQWLGEGRVDSVVTPDGRGLAFYIEVPYSRLVALAASERVDCDVAGRLEVLKAPTHVHYVRKGLIAESVYEGSALRALCGRWFVRKCGEESGLPICPDCERRLPVAREVLDHLTKMVQDPLGP